MEVERKGREQEHVSSRRIGMVVERKGRVQWRCSILKGR